MHHRFWDLIGDGFAHDVEVGGYEAAYQFCFQSFTLCEFRVLVWCRELGVNTISHVLIIDDQGDNNGENLGNLYVQIVSHIHSLDSIC